VHIFLPFQKIQKIFLASNEPRKNLITALDAFINNNIEGKLVVAGAKGWLNDIIEEKIKSAGDKVIRLGYVDEKNIGLLYAAAQALIYPSLYEGFGLPVLEAMACGTPTICSNISSLPEVAGEAAILIDNPEDSNAIADALNRIEKDNNLYLKLKAAYFTNAQNEFNANVVRTFNSIHLQLEESGQRTDILNKKISDIAQLLNLLQTKQNDLYNFHSQLNVALIRTEKMQSHHGAIIENYKDKISYNRQH